MFKRMLCWLFIIIVLLFLNSCTYEKSSQINIMSFNIRFGTANDGVNSWPNRKDFVFDVINNNQPHILGVQEALHFQLQEIKHATKNYKWIGVGRDDGKQAGEYSAVFYDTTRLSLLDEQTFWFSDTPDSIASVSWGNAITRICSWGCFRDKITHKTFYAYNVHWDHQSQNARERSAELMLQKISDRNYATDPFIITGDFNAGEDNPAFLKLIQNKRLKISDTFRTLYPARSNVGTFNAFSGDSSGAKIDAILISDQWQVAAAAIVTKDYDGRYPSDHFPVTAILSLK